MQKIPRLSLLLLEDDPNDADLVLFHLKKAGVELEGRRVDSREDFLTGLAESPDVILMDMNVPGFGALDALRLLREVGNQTPVVVLTGSLDDEAARECMDLGAADYLLKDRLARLVPAVLRASIEQKLRQEKEVALASQARLATVVEATPDLVGMADADGRVDYLNLAGRRMAGIGEDEDLSNFMLRDFTTKRAWRVLLKEAIPASLRDGSWNGETELRRRDGTVVPVSQVVIAHRNGGADRPYFSTIARDISERMRSEEELHKSQAWLRAVWEWSGDAMRLTDKNGTIREVNRNYCEMTGMRESELIGKPFTIAYPENGNSDLVWHGYRRRFQGRESLVRLEDRLEFRHAETRDVEVTFTGIETDGGERLLLTILRDISERKSLEKQFLRSQRLESIGALSGGVAHDFNNILTPVAMAASMLRMDLSADAREKALQTIEECAHRGADVVRRLMTFSKGIDGERFPQNPVDLIEEVARLVEQSFPRDVELRRVLPHRVPLVEADRTQMHQVLLNLCVNARDAMPNGGTLTFEVRPVEISLHSLPPSPHAKSGSFVVLSVADTGTGIPKENLERIFDPFFSTKSLQSGTGLGLSTSLGIVRSHGGFLSVKSEVGRGSRFDVYLPVSATKVTKADAAEAKGEEGAGGGNGAGKLILVVDDEVAIREMVCRMLEQFGYRSIGVEGGLDALRVLEQEGEIAGVITDLVMPGMSGVDFARAARTRFADLPIVAMSGRHSLGYVEALAEIGLTEIVEKPFRMERLLEAIQTALKSSSPSDS